MGDFPTSQQLAEPSQFLAKAPFMSRERRWSCGRSHRRQINKGYLPTVEVGRYSCVNVALLMRRCGDASLKLSLAGR